MYFLISNIGETFGLVVGLAIDGFVDDLPHHKDNSLAFVWTSFLSH